MNDNKIPNVHTLNCITNLDLKPDSVLSHAMGQLSDVVIIGYTKDGREYFAASKADGGNTLWHLERAKLKLLRMADE